MLVGVKHDRVFQQFLDRQEDRLFKIIRPPIAHTIRLVVNKGPTRGREYLLRRGRPLLVQTYRVIYRDAWRSIEPRRFTKAVDPWGEGISDFLSAQLDWLESEGGQQIQTITDNLVQDVIDMIMDGAAEGKSTDVIADEIFDEIPELSMFRAATIARTEVHNAALAAIDQTIRDKGFDLGVMRKRWWSALDDRVRESHREAHDQVVAFDQPFEVGDSLMMRPGDTSRGAGAEEVVNCRCACLYEEGEGAGEEGDLDLEDVGYS